MLRSIDFPAQTCNYCLCSYHPSNMVSNASIDGLSNSGSSSADLLQMDPEQVRDFREFVEEEQLIAAQEGSEVNPIGPTVVRVSPENQVEREVESSRKQLLGTGDSGNPTVSYIE